MEIIILQKQNNNKKKLIQNRINKMIELKQTKGQKKTSAVIAV